VPGGGSLVANGPGYLLNVVGSYPFDSYPHITWFTAGFTEDNSKGAVINYPIYRCNLLKG
jgi:hypothetical protein